MPNAMRINAVVLAAGRSQRFGSDKRALMLPGLLQQIDNALAGYLQSLVCVLRSSDDALALLPEKTNLPPEVLQLDDAQADKGMGQSLAAACKVCSDADAIMVFLADMPDISATSMQAVYHALASGRITVPVYEGRRGHPVGFGRDFFSELQQLHEDKGAKSLLSRYHPYVFEVTVNDPGVLLDIDTVTEWQEFKRNK